MFQSCFTDPKSTKKEFGNLTATSPRESKTLSSCESLYWFPEYLNEGPLKSEYDLEWKGYLLLKNFEELENTSVISKKRFSFYTPKIVKSVFNLCKMLRQPPEVRYLALEILDRFLVQHFFKVSGTFEEIKDYNIEMWQAIIERMLQQSPLRILSSIQLAMKYSWSCNVITATEIQEMLKIFNNKVEYPKKSILKSEARIYKQLDFNISYKTPFTYIEMFFNDFQKHEFFNLNISLQKFFITCIHVLDVTIVFHKQIYDKLRKRKQKNVANSPFMNFSLAFFKANFVALAASVIFASSVLEDSSAVTSKIILETLCSIGNFRKFEIQKLGQQILDIISNI